MSESKISWSHIGLIEEAVFHEPEGMEGWRCYRIEYGGTNESCLMEGRIWLPRHASPDMVEVMLRGMIATENAFVWG